MKFSTFFILASTILAASALPVNAPAAKYSNKNCQYAEIIAGMVGRCSKPWIVQQTLCDGFEPACKTGESFPPMVIPESLSSLWPLPRTIMTGTELPADFTTTAPKATTDPPLSFPTTSTWDPKASAQSSRVSEIVASGGIGSWLDAQPTATALPEACKLRDHLVNVGMDCTIEWRNALESCVGPEAAKKECEFQCGPIEGVSAIKTGTNGSTAIGTGVIQTVMPTGTAPMYRGPKPTAFRA